MWKTEGDEEENTLGRTKIWAVTNFPLSRNTVMKGSTPLIDIYVVNFCRSLVHFLMVQIVSERKQNERCSAKAT